VMVQTAINGNQFRCPDCGGGTVREFSEAIVSCEIVRFGVNEDGCPFVDEETEITLQKTISEPEYECARCRRHFEIRNYPQWSSRLEGRAASLCLIPILITANGRCWARSPSIRARSC